MTEPWTCAQLDEVSAELALGLLTGNERCSSLDHLETCPRCRDRVAANATVVDHLLNAGPRVEPPAGFETRVLEAIAAAQPAAQPVAQPAVSPMRQRRSAWLAVTAVAAVIIVSLTIGLGLLGRSGAGTRVASMIGADGTTVGKVELGRRPSTVLVALPGWYERGGAAATYRMTIKTQSGRSVVLGALQLNEGGTWSGTLPVDPATVTSVVLDDASGRPLCHASLAKA